MTTRPVPTTITARPRTARHPGLARRVVGGFYLSMGGVHVGIVAVDPTVYRSFADAAYLSFVRTGWNEIFMADPRMWGLALALGETLLGTALLVGGGWGRLGWIGVIGFHLALMLFGFGIWLWCIPALALLVPLARADWQRLSTTTSTGR
ncbi:MAG TPA: hypothetical protein VJ819_03435 [Nocardioidaceae bacterium]|nr:hypothetical protein [Nocardioidaceae bacterium]